MALITNEQIEEIKKRLVETYHPSQIYIFGSYAWGTPDEESDIDLMIIVPSADSNISLPQRTVAGYRALFGLDIAKELIILTEAEFAERSSNKNYLAYKVKHDGTCIYTRS